MNLPSMLLATTVLFWGWQSGLWWIAAAIAVVLETPRVTNIRVVLSMSDVTRVANFCTVLLLGVVFYLYFREGLAQAIISIVKWLPVVLLPLALAIVLGGMRSTDLSTISFALRHRASGDSGAARSVNLGYPYLALWLLAASVSNQPGWGFYLGLVGLGAWTLWSLRPRGHSALLWAGVFLMAALGGALINTGLYRLQELVEQVALEWLNGEADEDPERTRTSLGHIGELKLSDSIALRVTTAGALRTPLLLRTASYNLYASSSWSAAGGSSFIDLPRVAPAAPWILNQGGAAATLLEISTSSARPTSLIALPPGAQQVESERFERVSRNRLGTLQAELTPGFYTYRVNYGVGFTSQAAPVADDLQLPRSDSALLLDVARRLQLPGRPTAIVMPALKNYFAENFSYSTFRAGNGANQSALSDFLQRNRSGHCEHFATATVLLLRAAGIPARYTVGYSVDERSRFGGGYVARRRHAHAWVNAYIDGAWQDFDTTPASWPQLEKESASWFEPLLDTWSWLLFQARKFNFSGYELLAYMIGLSALAWFGRKINWRAVVFNPVRLRNKLAVTLANGTNAFDSQLYRIEKMLAERGCGRPPDEPLTDWLARIAPQIDADASAALTQIVALHYRCRFGPQPVPAEHLERLQRAGRDWIARFERANHRDILAER